MCRYFNGYEMNKIKLNVCTIVLSLFIYLFIWRESKGTFKSDGERGEAVLSLILKAIFCKISCVPTST